MQHSLSLVLGSLGPDLYHHSGGGSGTKGGTASEQQRPGGQRAKLRC
jgi:hypothetical protein